MRSERELYEAFDEYLDEIYGVVSIGGNDYEHSYALKEVDPTAYDEGFNNWFDEQPESREEEEQEEGE